MITETSGPGAVSGPTDIIAALHQASAKTGSDFAYLLGTAMRESSLKTQVKSATSSATGLFQFIDQTWLGLIKRFGNSNGLGQYSDAIRQTEDGRYAVGSAETKSAILALRKDPAVAALMAGEAASETKKGMEGTLGRQVSCGELYAAHFLGQGSACRLIALNQTDPGQRADILFPQAAKTNRSVFFNADGTAKTVGEIYNWAVQLPSGAHAAPSVPQNTENRVAVASQPVALRNRFDTADDFSTPAASRFRPSRSGVPDTAATTPQNMYSPFHVAPRAVSPAGFPQTAGLVLTPGVIEILASLNAGTAFGTARRAS